MPCEPCPDKVGTMAWHLSVLCPWLPLLGKCLKLCALPTSCGDPEVTSGGGGGVTVVLGSSKEHRACQTGDGEMMEHTGGLVLQLSRLIAPPKHHCFSWIQHGLQVASEGARVLLIDRC